MTHLRLTTVFFLLSGCASVHEVPDPPPPDPIEPITLVPGVIIFQPPIQRVVPLEECLDGGGALTLVASVNNDDVTEHGAIATLAVDAAGTIAVAASDGTIKLWTIEDGFLGQLSTSQILYGAELGRTPSTDILLHENWVVAGDINGLVSAWTLDGAMEIWGGTDPGIGIVAVAFDAPRRIVAHADTQVGGHIMLRGIDGGTTVGPLATEVGIVRDLGFFADGSLVVAGTGVEVRDPEDATLVTARYEGDVTEVATVGNTLAIAGPSSVAMLDQSLSPSWTIDATAHAPIGVALTSSGRYAITAGADGSLRVLRGTDGAEIGSADVTDPVVIRAEPTGRTILVGSREGMVHAFECRAVE